MPEELMLQDLADRYASAEIKPAFTRLYPTDTIGRMCASLHQRLNELLGFMNYKIGSNRHFNADQSRDLILLIEEIREAKEVLNLGGRELLISHYYGELLEECSTFLLQSGGSPIPENFKRIELVKYEAVFTLPDTHIRIPERHTKYELKLIGSGSYANVYSYTDPVYGVPFALKRAKQNLASKDLERFRREFEILKELRFPYVLQVYQYEGYRNEYTMEHCDTTLLDYIDKNNAWLSFGTRKRIALQFLYGMNFLHSKDCLHRDISHRNVLLKLYNGGAVVVKLSDFGLSKDRDSTLTTTESELRGTILDPTITSFKDYSVLNEIYPIGFLLSFIFSGRRDIAACTGDVRKIVDKCVVHDLAARYADVRSIIQDVEDLDAPAERDSETPV